MTIISDYMRSMDFKLFTEIKAESQDVLTKHKYNLISLLLF